MFEDTCPFLEFLSEVPLISSIMSPGQINLSTWAWLPGIRSRTKTRPPRYLRDSHRDKGDDAAGWTDLFMSGCALWKERKEQTSTPSLPPDRALLHMFHTPGNIYKQLTDRLSHPAESKFRYLTAMCPAWEIFPCISKDVKVSMATITIIILLWYCELLKNNHCFLPVGASSHPENCNSVRPGVVISGESFHFKVIWKNSCFHQMIVGTEVFKVIFWKKILCGLKILKMNRFAVFNGRNRGVALTSMSSLNSMWERTSSSDMKGSGGGTTLLLMLDTEGQRWKEFPRLCSAFSGNNQIK